MDSLEIDPGLKNDVLLVRTKDADPEELKVNIAKVLNASWIHRAEGWYLWQTDEQKAADRKTNRSERLKFCTRLAEQSKRQLANAKPFDEAECKRLVTEIKALATMPRKRNDDTFYRRVGNLDQQSPQARLANRMLQRITPNTWMKLTDQNPRIVFCTHPNSMQQSLPFQTEDLIALARQEQESWASYAGSTRIQPAKLNSDDDDEMDSLGDLNDRRTPFGTSDFSVVTMVLDLNAETVSVHAYDNKGISTFTSIVYLDDSELEENSELNQAKQEALRKKMITVSGEAAEYLDLVSPLNSTVRRSLIKRAISPSLLGKMMNPESIDPLSVSAPDVFLNNIEAPNVVILLSESHRSMRYPPYKALPSIRLEGNIMVNANGWLVVGQPDPLLARKLMPNRKKLGTVMRFIGEKKRPLTLEEKASLALELPWEQDSFSIFDEYLQPIQLDEVDSYNNRDALRIYGSIDGSTKSRAIREPVPLSFLSDSAKLELYRGLFLGSENVSISVEPYDDDKITATQREAVMKLDEQLYGGILEESTFALPFGLTNNMKLSIEETSQDLLYCGYEYGQSSENRYYTGTQITPETLGEQLFNLTKPKRSRYEYMIGKVDENEIHLVSQRSITINLHIDPLKRASWQLEQVLVTDPKTYTIKTLPREIATKVKEAYDQAEKQDKEMGSAGINLFPRRQGTKVPPPPDAPLAYRT